jgi:putative ABC transport system substrate-binding protein
MLTGVAQLNHAITAKRLELLHDIVPGQKSIAFFHDANNPSASDEPKEVLAAAATTGQQVHIVEVSGADGLPAAFDQAVTSKAGAILLGSGPVFTNGRHIIIDLAAKHRIPAAYSLREFADAGGLVSYGSNIGDGFLQIGRYASRILKGERPADLPVVQPTKFELIINLKAAKALGIDIPAVLLSRADEVIE